MRQVLFEWHGMKVYAYTAMLYLGLVFGVDGPQYDQPRFCQALRRLLKDLRDGHPRTLDEVAQTYGITRERIRQIEARSLSKLRQPIRSNRLAGFTERDK